MRAADAEEPSSRSGRGLFELVRRAWPRVAAAVEQALADGDAAAPMLLVDAAHLARYDNVELLARWTDLAAPRPSEPGLRRQVLGVSRQDELVLDKAGCAAPQ